MKIIAIGLLGLLLCNNTLAQETTKNQPSILEEYNSKRAEFLKKREIAKQIYLQNVKLEEQRIKQYYEEQEKRDALRLKYGLPISRHLNVHGPNKNEAGVSREMMVAMSNGKMPAVPPTGNIQEAK